MVKAKVCFTVEVEAENIDTFLKEGAEMFGEMKIGEIDDGVVARSIHLLVADEKGNVLMERSAR